MALGCGLTFGQLTQVNLARAAHWHKGGIEEWSVADWAVAAAGEMGEVCDAVKKLRRIESGLESQNPSQPKDRADAIKKIAQEIGDTVVYLDLLAARLGLRLDECVADTFNRVSRREGLDFWL